MKRFLLFFAFLGACHAQITLNLTGPPTLVAGKTYNAAITLTGTSNLNLATVKWSYGTLPAGITLGFGMVVSPAAPANPVTIPPPNPNATTICGPNSCLNYGFAGATINPLIDGTVTYVYLNVGLSATPGAATISLQGSPPATDAADFSGNPVTVSIGSPYSFTISPSACDVNGDGKVDATDIGIMARALIGQGACPLSGIGGCSLQNFVAVIIAAVKGTCSL